MITTVLVQLALAVALAALGWWGGRSAAAAIPVSLPPAQYHRKLRTIRRGVRSCYVVAAFLALTTIPITL